MKFNIFKKLLSTSLIALLFASSYTKAEVAVKKKTINKIQSTRKKKKTRKPSLKASATQNVRKLKKESTQPLENKSIVSLIQLLRKTNPEALKKIKLTAPSELKELITRIEKGIPVNFKNIKKSISSTKQSSDHKYSSQSNKQEIPIVSSTRSTAHPTSKIASNITPHITAAPTGTLPLLLDLLGDPLPPPLIDLAAPPLPLIDPDAPQPPPLIDLAAPHLPLIDPDAPLPPPLIDLAALHLPLIDPDAPLPPPLIDHPAAPHLPLIDPDAPLPPPLIDLAAPHLPLIDLDAPLPPPLIDLAAPHLPLIDLDAPLPPPLIDLAAPRLPLIDLDAPLPPPLIDHLAAPHLPLIDPDAPLPPPLIDLAAPHLPLIDLDAPLPPLPIPADPTAPLNRADFKVALNKHMQGMAPAPGATNPLLAIKKHIQKKKDEKSAALTQAITYSLKNMRNTANPKVQNDHEAVIDPAVSPTDYLPPLDPTFLPLQTLKDIKVDQYLNAAQKSINDKQMVFHRSLVNFKEAHQTLSKDILPQLYQAKINKTKAEYDKLTIIEEDINAEVYNQATQTLKEKQQDLDEITKTYNQSLEMLGKKKGELTDIIIEANKKDEKLQNFNQIKSILLKKEAQGLLYKAEMDIIAKTILSFEKDFVSPQDHLKKTLLDRLKFQEIQKLQYKYDELDQNFKRLNLESARQKLKKEMEKDDTKMEIDSIKAKVYKQLEEDLGGGIRGRHPGINPELDKYFNIFE